MSVPTIKLNDGNTMPQLGLGVWQASDAEARAAVRHAIESGYRSVDTASIYRNENGVGQGVKDAGVQRSEIFLTTKIWNSDQGTDSTVRGLEDSLRRLDTDYVDLLLIHWPAARRGRYQDTWETMIGLKEKGLTRSIGVSNFQPEHLKAIAKLGATPAVNQIELHPYLQQHALRKLHSEMGIATECWSPLAQSQALKDPIINELAAKHRKTAAQIVLRWHLDSGFVVIPKSVTPERIESNIDVFDFQLDQEDMAIIGKLDQNYRIGPNPDTFD